jgi:hypothetical protein
MVKTRPKWSEKLTRSRPAEVKRLDKSGAGMTAGQLMLISSPADLDAAIRAVPKGSSIDVPSLREQLARAAGAEVTCPLTTGIFLRIVTEAANEAHESGVSPTALTPVWRVIDRKLPLVKKLSFDPEWLFQLREAESA